MSRQLSLDTHLEMLRQFVSRSIARVWEGRKEGSDRRRGAPEAFAPDWPAQQDRAAEGSHLSGTVTQ